MATPNATLTVEQVRAAAEQLRAVEQLIHNARENALEKASAILARVVKAVGAQLIAPQSGMDKPLYSLRVRNRRVVVDRVYEQGVTFFVNYSHILVIGDPAFLLNSCCTCYQVMGSMPPDEKLAVALLRLKSNPEEFRYLCRQPHCWIGRAEHTYVYPGGPDPRFVVDPFTPPF